MNRWILAAPLLATLLVESAAAQFLGTDFTSGNASGATADATSAAIGTNATASGVESLAVGLGAQATGMNSTAVGNSAQTIDQRATALGYGSNADLSGTALGHNAVAGGEGVAAGSDSNTGFAGVAVGDGANADFFAIAIGAGAEATQSGSIVLGALAQATGVESGAIGVNAEANHENSFAIGTEAATTRDNQIMLGTAATTYTVRGIASASSTAAQVGSTQIVTTDATGNLAAATPESFGFVTADQLDQFATGDDLDRTAEGVAMAMALSGVPNILPEGANYGLSVDWGNFDGENAMAFGGSAPLVENVFINGGGAVGTAGRSSGGGRAGVTVAW